VLGFNLHSKAKLWHTVSFYETYVKYCIVICNHVHCLYASHTFPVEKLCEFLLLCYVLLWRVRRRGEVRDALLVAVLLKLAGVELPAAVRAERPQVTLLLGLSMCPDFLEPDERFILGFQQLQTHIPAIVINNQEEVVISTCSCWLDRPTQIGVGRGRGRGRSGACSPAGTQADVASRLCSRRRSRRCDPPAASLLPCLC
jgi:hypothetical protein